MVKGIKCGLSILLVLITVAAVFAAVMTTPAVANPGVVVDGVMSSGEWDNPIIWINDTSDALGTAPPGYNTTQVRVIIEGNTLYALFILAGVAGDADGNGNPNTGPGDYPGIGQGATFTYEEYNLYIDKDNDTDEDYWLRYTQGGTLLTEPGLSVNLGAATFGAFGTNIVEMSLANAASWINLDDFCVRGMSDTDTTGSEDYTDWKCYKRLVCPKAVIADPGCYEEEGSEIIFDGSKSSVDPPYTIVNYSWTFSDGTKAEGAKVKKIVTAPITATLTVRASSGCEDTATVRVDQCIEAPLLGPVGLIALIVALSAVLLVSSRYRRSH